MSPGTAQLLNARGNDLPGIQQGVRGLIEDWYVNAYLIMTRHRAKNSIRIDPITMIAEIALHESFVTPPTWSVSCS